MNINISPVKYSSIVEIGEQVSELEKTGQKFLKLHRGVMDIETIDLNSFSKDIDFNQKKLQQYGGNDGDSELLNTIKNKFHLEQHHIIITPGGMAAIDLVINSLSNQTFLVPKYHWGSWNKILTVHDKKIKLFDDFDIANFKPMSGVILLCYPSNPTGFSPKPEDLNIFLEHCKTFNITVILDFPYFYLFNDVDDEIYKSYHDNVIILSSFSKSAGLSGFRVGYAATKNQQLYDTMKIRSLYKYNSISNVSQHIIQGLLITEHGKKALDKYQKATKTDIKKNIQYLIDNNLLFNEYPTNSIPVGPFAIINKTFDELMKNSISSVPLGKFTIFIQKGTDVYEKLNKFSRISVAVKHDLFVEYFDKMKSCTELA